MIIFLLCLVGISQGQVTLNKQSYSQDTCSNLCLAQNLLYCAANYDFSYGQCCYVGDTACRTYGPCSSNI